MKSPRLTIDLVSSVRMLTVFAALALLLPLASSAPEAQGSVLTEPAMSALFGNDPPEVALPSCFTSYTCLDAAISSTQVINGITYNCRRCDSDTASRKLCCSTTSQTKRCNYNGGVICNGYDQWFGFSGGNPDSCGVYPTCSLDRKFQTCGQGDNQATGDGC